MKPEHVAMLHPGSVFVSLINDAVAGAEPDNSEVVLDNLHFGIVRLLGNEQRAEEIVFELDRVVEAWADEYGADVVALTISFLPCDALDDEEDEA